MRQRHRNILLKSRPIRIAHLHYPRANQVARLFVTILQTLIPDRRHFHLHWSTRKLQLNVKLAISPGKIVLTDTNCRNNQRQTRMTDVKRMAIKRRQAAGAVRIYSRIREAQSKRQTRARTLEPAPFANETA